MSSKISDMPFSPALVLFNYSSECTFSPYLTKLGGAFDGGPKTCWMLPLTWVPLFFCQLYGYMESEPLTLQLFIGTADDRLLRPHAFYQVHRITGKTVSTASHEVMQSNTKVLEIPLLPENNMRAMWVHKDFHNSSILSIFPPVTQQKTYTHTSNIFFSQALVQRFIDNMHDNRRCAALTSSKVIKLQSIFPIRRHYISEDDINTVSTSLTLGVTQIWTVSASKRLLKKVYWEQSPSPPLWTFVAMETSSLVFFICSFAVCLIKCSVSIKLHKVHLEESL